jgi:hypothetical protein
MVAEAVASLGVQAIFIDVAIHRILTVTNSEVQAAREQCRGRSSN